MTELVDRLEQELSAIRILKSSSVSSVRPRGGDWSVELETGEAIPADAVILAAPACRSAELVGDADSELGRLLSGIPYASPVIIHLAFREEDVGRDLDAYGYVIPATEGNDLIACTWSSRKWAGRAPPGTVLFRLNAGRFGRRDLQRLPEEEVFSLARRELAATLGITAAPLLSRISRWEAAMPQYLMDHPQRLRAIDERVAQLPGLFLAGASYRGVGVPDCIASGQDAARQALQGMGLGEKTAAALPAKR
jgi:oxygen-dependent protoporphyrinogen oxidase